MPSDNIERRVVLRARVELAAQSYVGSVSSSVYLYVNTHLYTTAEQALAPHRDRSILQALTLPLALVDLEARHRVLEVTDVCKTVGAKRTELGELVVRAEDFLNVCMYSDEYSTTIKDDVWRDTHSHERLRRGAPPGRSRISDFRTET